jgi:hypothetical protein
MISVGDGVDKWFGILSICILILGGLSLVITGSEDFYGSALRSVSTVPTYDVLPTDNPNDRNIRDIIPTPLDESAPILTFTVSPSNIVPGTNVRIAANAIDPSGIQYLRLYVNDVLSNNCPEYDQMNQESVSCTHEITVPAGTTPFVISYYATTSDNSRNHNTVRDPENGVHTIIVNPLNTDNEGPEISVSYSITTQNNQGSLGPNVLLNPTFASGTNLWTYYNSTSGSFTITNPGTDDNNAARISVISQQSNMQLYQSGIQLTSGRYRISFDAKSSSGNNIRVTLQNHVSPYNNYGMNKVIFDLTTQWQTFTHDFDTAGFNGTASNARLMYWLANDAVAGDIYYIDNIKLQKIN